MKQILEEKKLLKQFLNKIPTLCVFSAIAMIGEFSFAVPIVYNCEIVESISGESSFYEVSFNPWNDYSSQTYFFNNSKLRLTFNTQGIFTINISGLNQNWSKGSTAVEDQTPKQVGLTHIHSDSIDSFTAVKCIL